MWWIGADTETTSVTQYLTGTTWIEVPAPNIGRLRSLSGVGPNDAWAVSATGSLHYDGTGWTIIPLDSGADTVMADGPTSAWAVGSGLIWHTVLGTVCPTATPTVTPTATPTPTETPTPHPGQFQDVPPSNTFYTYVECMGTRGIISGYPCSGPGEPCVPDTKPYFRPNNNLTRGQVSKIVVSAAGWADPVPSTQQTFEDVAPGSTFWLWIERLAERGIIGGYPCGGPNESCQPPMNRPYFRQNNNLTRAQLAKIDSGAAGYTETPIGQTFEDVPPGSTFYTWVEQVAGRGIVGGYPCGGAGEPCQPPGNRPYYRPNNNVTRGQAAKIVTNTFFPGCGSGTPSPTPTSTVEWTPTATPTGTPAVPPPTLTGTPTGLVATPTGTPTSLAATATATP